jgi:hypothetical protein
MKKLILGFILGNALVMWLVGKVMKFVYKAAPEPFNYIWYEVFLPTVKNMIVDTVETGVKRTVYPEGRPYSGPRPFNPNDPRIRYNNPKDRPKEA